MTKKPSFFEDLREALEEAIQHCRGEVLLRTTFVVADPPNLAAREVRRLRKRLKMSIADFARMINVTVKTVEDWEDGARKPTQAALRLLQVVNEQPELVRQVAGVTKTFPRGKTSKKSRQRKVAVS